MVILYFGRRHTHQLNIGKTTSLFVTCIRLSRVNILILTLHDSMTRETQEESKKSTKIIVCVH